MSSHCPQTRKAPDDDDYLIIPQPMQTTLEDCESLAIIALAAENVSLDKLWSRLRHVEKSHGNPSVIIFHLDPYLSGNSLETAAAVKRAGNEAAFSVGLGHEAIPRTVKALEEMVRMSVKVPLLGDAPAPDTGLDMGVSRLGFSAAGMDAMKKTYDNYVDALRKLKEVKEKEHNLGLRIHKEEETDTIMAELKELDPELKKCSSACKEAFNRWSDLLEESLLTMSDESLIIQHMGEWTDMDKIMPKEATSLDRLRFRHAAMSRDQHAIAIAYHGDLNLKSSVQNLTAFLSPWTSARYERHRMYKSLLAKIKDGKYKEDRPDTWPRPDRVTDYFVFTLPKDGIKDFIQKIVDTRNSLESHLSDALNLARQQDAEEGQD